MKVLHVVLYTALYPPKNGGMLRCWNLAVQLSTFAETDVLCLQPDIIESLKNSGEKVNGSMRFLVPLQTIKITSLFQRVAAAVKFRWYFKTLAATNSTLLHTIPVLKQLKNQHYDFIIFEHLESLAIYNIIKKKYPLATYVFDAHNVDHILLKNKLNPKSLENIKRSEGTLYTRFKLILTCSKEDGLILKALNRNRIKVSTIPNGIDVSKNAYQPPKDTDRFNLLFCGSLDYEPNYNGLCWFLQDVWPQVISALKNVNFTIIGRGKPDISLLEKIKASTNVNFLGEVDNVKPHYRKANLAIAPLLHGSGTRLKILEAMSLGLPVISTSKGAEGIDFVEGQNIIIADNAKDFSQKIIDSLNDYASISNISKAARQLAENKYSWNVVGLQLKTVLNEYAGN